MATVPGEIHTDLMRAGLLADPYSRFNDLLYRWVALDDWTFSRTFVLNSKSTTTEALFGASQQVLLICDRLDTVATITLNGKVLGSANNQFRRWIWPVKDLLLPSGKENSISIAFQSAAAYATAQAAKYPYTVPSMDSPVQHGEPHRNFIRKEQCSFSWDWGPAFLPQGISGPIRLVAFEEAFLLDVSSQSSLHDNSIPSFDMRVRARIIAASEGIQVRVSAMVAGAQENRVVTLHAGENSISLDFIVTKPLLWWPRGYGDANLYDLTVTVQGSDWIQQDTKRVGFHDIKLVQEPISGETGLSFFLQVNSVPIFAKGANWIPADSFESRVTEPVLRNLLSSAFDANMNILRVWGGGIYQQDLFYELCDQLGIMVWQEMMFACAMYPRDQAFLDNVREEVSHQVHRLMHHPSVVLWSGNNENEAAFGWFPETLANPFLYVVDYAKLYEDTIIRTVRELDNTRPFVVSSPSNGMISMDPLVERWGDPQSEKYGDVHYYNYAALCTDVSKFPRPRFASEYGFQAYPSFDSIAQVSFSSDWTWGSALMEHRQHHQNGNTELVKQMQMHFSLPKSRNQTVAFDHMLYLTQCVQALCIKAESEHYRRIKTETPGHTMGAIYWQLNDIWQAPTWSSLEYNGRWKMLHYFAKQFFSPVLVSSYEAPSDHFGVYVTSDLTLPISGFVNISMWSWKGFIAAQWQVPFALPALDSKQFFSNKISAMLATAKGCERNTCFISLLCTDKDGSTVFSTNEFFLSSFADVALSPAGLKFSGLTQIEPNHVSFQLSSENVAPFVWLENNAIPGRFSNNGFLLLPHQSVTFHFFGQRNFSTQEFASSLQMRSLQNTLE